MQIKEDKYFIFDRAKDVNLKYILKEKGYSQNDLARESGVSQQAISRYVNKERVPAMDKLIAIAVTLNVDVDDLIYFGDEVDIHEYDWRH